MSVLTIADAIERAHALAQSRRRVLLGIAGPPGVGKSTLAQRIVEHLGAQACLVAMDGFHLAQRELERLGRTDREGAPDTFDAAGYVAMLRRLRDPGEDVVYAPQFLRELEEPIAGAVPVAPTSQSSSPRATTCCSRTRPGLTFGTWQRADAVVVS